jgi:hypothetical protein
MVDRPWMVALEEQFAALRSTRQLLRDDPKAPEWFHQVRDHLRQASCYAWNTETTAALVSAARTVPPATLFQRAVLPSPLGWWWFEAPVKLPHRIDDSIDHIVALLWGPAGPEEPAGIVVRMFVRARFTFVDPFPFAQIHIRDGDRLDVTLSAVQLESDPEFKEAELHAAVWILSVLMAGATWLQSRVVSWTSGHIERHRRKQLAREANAPLPSDVKVIELRRAESMARAPDGSGEVVDWSCRWVVDGHWRNQPYKDEHKLVYIMPYVKGPADKPLKVPAHTVFAVRR